MRSSHFRIRVGPPPPEVGTAPTAPPLHSGVCGDVCGDVCVSLFWIPQKLRIKIDILVLILNSHSYLVYQRRGILVQFSNFDLI